MSTAARAPTSPCCAAASPTPAAPSARPFCAEVELDPAEAGGDPHPAIRNLVRAGFKQMAVRPVWGR